jgi:hypothetical protein
LAHTPIWKFEQRNILRAMSVSTASMPIKSDPSRRIIAAQEVPPVPPKFHSFAFLMACNCGVDMSGRAGPPSYVPANMFPVPKGAQVSHVEESSAPYDGSL